MDVTAVKKAFLKFQEEEIGGTAWVSVRLTHSDSVAEGNFSCSVWPDGAVGDLAFCVYDDDLTALLVKARAAWEDYTAPYHRKMIRKMALAIIRITADIGHCTDAALRAEFGPILLARYGADACLDANKIADKGPFSIVTLGGDNGAPLDLDANKPEGATVN